MLVGRSRRKLEIEVLRRTFGGGWGWRVGAGEVGRGRTLLLGSRNVVWEKRCNVSGDDVSSRARSEGGMPTSGSASIFQWWNCAESVMIIGGEEATDFEVREKETNAVDSMYDGTRAQT